MSLSLLQAGGTGLVLSLAALTPWLAGDPQSAPAVETGAPQLGALAYLDTPTGVDVEGERLAESAYGPGVIEGMDAVLAREAALLELGLHATNPKLRNGRQGSWEIPSRRRTGFPHSGSHYATAKWGDTTMGIGFGGEVDLIGVWIAGQATPQVWAPAVRAVGFRAGLEVAATEWFDDVDGTPSWLPIDFDAVDRVVFEARAAIDGAGFYGLDDLTFERRGGQRGRTETVVLDFEDLDYRAGLTGSGYAGLTWEAGSGDFSRPNAVHAPVTPAGQPGLRASDTTVPGGTTAGTQSVSTTPGLLVATQPTLLMEFEGPNQSDPGAGWIPPDAHGAIGPNHFVSVVNQHMSVYDKSTTTRLLNTSLQTFFGGSSAVSKGDPRILYDHFADRWVLIASDFGQGASGIHFAWSVTSDPTGSWYKDFIVLAQGADAGTWPDYPALGLDAEGIYVGVHMVGNSMSLFAIDKAPLLNLVPFLGTVTAWRSLPWEGSLHPALTYGFQSGCHVTSRFSLNLQRIRRVNPPLTAPTLTQLGFIGTKNGQPPGPAPALGSTVDLDTLDARHMNTVYRNGSLWTTHCVDKAGRSAINWYELDPSTMTVVQEGTVKSGTDHYHYPSIAVNSAGDAVIGFSASSPTTYIGAWFTGRLATDPAGEMAIPIEYRVGGGPYTQLSNGLNRWGDYSMTTVDPSDDLGFWTIQAHAKGNSTWGTRVAQLQYGGCLAPTASKPMDAGACLGGSASFTTIAGGTGPFTYQWRKGTVEIPGETTDTLNLTSITAGDAGSYICVVTDLCGSTASLAGLLTINAPTTASNPVSANICDGNLASFFVNPGGTGPFTYQWRKDGIDIPGAVNSSYSIATVAPADAGDYDVVVTGACNSVTTAAATLTVSDAVTATDPLAVDECEGAPASFDTTPGGTGPFTYQWRKDGIDIPGATSSSLSIAAVTLADAGDYDVVVTGACSAATTAAATLSVGPPSPSAPLDATVCTAGSASFSTTVGGAGPFTYQWRLNGVDIGGATSASYSVAAAGPADEGDYDVVVTGACGSVASATAALVIDDTVTALDPSAISVCEGAPATFTSGAVGAGPFSYQWRKDGIDIGGATSSSYTIAAATATDLGTYDVVVTGACSSDSSDTAMLTLDAPVTASDPVGGTACGGTPFSFDTTAGGTGPFTYQWRLDGLDIGGATASSYSIGAVTPADAGSYDVVVTGTCGSLTTAAAALAVDTAVTATDPLGATACEGSPVSFDTVASGTGALTYQWRKDGIDIGGATSSSYTLAAIAPGDAGDYDVVVTGTCGAFTTAAATLTVDAAPTATAPLGANVCQGAPVSFDTVAAGAGPLTYQWRKDAVDIGGATSSSLSIGAVAAGDAGVYDVVVTGACGAVTSAGATLVVDSPVTASDPLDASGCTGASASFDTTAGGTGPFTYQWKKDGVDIGGATASSYAIAALAPADAGAYSVQVTGACGSLETAAAALAVFSVPVATDPLSATVCDGSSASFDTVASGTGPFTYQWKLNGVDIAGATSNSYTIAAVGPGDVGDYTVEVTDPCGSIETAPAALTIGTAPTATDPLPQAGCIGDSASFDTVAGGAGPYTYQWKLDGGDIPGATSSSYTIAALVPGDAGNYSVAVTSPCGSVETAAAGLVINDPVTATDPQSTTVCPGAPVTLNTTAGGTGPFSYQWKVNGAVINGATASSYAIAAVAPSDAGDYSVEVTGVCGQVETAAAQLNVGVTMTNYCTAGTSASGCQATMAGSGTPSASAASGFVVIATGVEGDKDGLFFFGKNGRQTNPWGNSTSLQCIVPPVRRGGLINGNGTDGQCDGITAQDLNARWQAKPNHNPGAGATVQIQFWYRDPANTSNQSTSFSDALEVPVCP